ncbi:MAG: hypothetical protein FWD14_04510 [Treponema sp.]|nr:hypothetical protein [Treponema sp.]
MSRLWNSILLLCVIAVVSCGFIDLRPIGVDIEPDINDSVLPDAFSPVILRFDTEMIKNETEANMQISSDLGVMRGDKHWNGSSLYFVPVAGWTAGIRYTLSLTGMIRSADGREMRTERFVSFYAINKNNPPLLEWFSPSDGISVGTNNLVMEFHFSRSMDRLSAESALTLEGAGSKTFEWSDDDKILKAAADKPLSPWQLYRWNLKESAKSKDGVPLPKSYSGFFTTDLDQVLPQVTDVYPVLFSSGSWFPTGADIETGLMQGQGIAVSFNKPMGENALRSLRFEPALSGRTEFLSENAIVYILARDPDPQTAYTLIVSGDTKDSEGLKTGTDYRITFIPDIPFLEVESITGSFAYEKNSLANNVIPVLIDHAMGELSFYIHFSLLFSGEEKQITPQKITLVPFFPRTIAPAALQYVNWISDDRLFMRWEGLSAGEIPHYYKLVIPGGRSGINSDTGIFMKEDLILYLEAIL